LLENIFIMRKTLLFGLLLAGVTTVAQNIFRDDLIAYNTGVQLNGQGSWSNNSSNGGSGSCTGPLCNNAFILAQGISYPSYGTATKSLEIGIDRDGIGTLFTPVSTTDVYFGMVVNFSNAAFSGTINDFFRITTGAFSTAGRIFAKKTVSNSLVFGIGKTSGSTYDSANEFSFDTDHLLIVKYTKNAGSSDDVIKLFIDPNFATGEPMTANVTIAGGTDNTGIIKSLNFFLNTSQGIPTGKAGLVSVSSSWEDLAFNLSNNQFAKETFTIASTKATSGLVSIKSNLTFENITLNIYDIQGRKVTTELISLEASVNDIAINPIKNAGVYVLELLSENNDRFTQKIIVK
jgi:hypothetical protein